MRNLLTSLGVTVAIILAVCFSALSAVYWHTELSGQSDWIVYLAVIGSVCVSLMGPVSAYLIRSYSWFLIIPALVFITADCYQNAQGYEAFKGFTVSTDVEAAQTRLNAARIELAALPLPNASGAIRQASTWETLNTALSGRVEAAALDLKALQTPSAPMSIVFSVMAAIQFVLSIFFACIGKPVEKTKPATKVKSKKRSEAAKKGWERRKAKEALPLRLVAAND